MKFLKKSDTYEDYKITLLGNTAWQGLSEELDSDFVDNFIWLDRKRFNKDLIYRYRKLKEIVSVGYDVVLCPVYSREFFYTDNIVKLINAREKIGSVGDLSNIKKWQKSISDRYYTRLILAKNEIMFEFCRNKEFFENLLNMRLDIANPFIKLKPKVLPFELPLKYAILFIGASANYRKWNIEGFVKVGQYLKSKFGFEIVLCGAPVDKDDAIEFGNNFSYSYVDLVGKTSLIELCHVIANASLMISNETSAPHLAVAVGLTKILVISNGNHFGRFTPYPKEITDNYHAIYHPLIERDLDDYKKLSNSYGYGSKLDINEITYEMVRNKIDEVLKTNV